MIQVLILLIGTGLATTGLIGAGLGVGVVFRAILGVARNPSLKGQLFCYVILGFAFAEAICLFLLILLFFINILTDTSFILSFQVVHIYYILIIGTVFSLLTALYFLMPKLPYFNINWVFVCSPMPYGFSSPLQSLLPAAAVAPAIFWIPDYVMGMVCTQVGEEVINGIIHYTYYSGDLIITVSTILFR